MDIDVKNLHPLEVRVLRHVSSDDDITPEGIIQDLGYKVGQCNQAFSWLQAKGCLEEVSRASHVIYELTDAGRKMVEEGGPIAERIFNFVLKFGPHTLPSIAEALKLEKSEVGSAFGLLSSKGTAQLDSEKKASIKKPSLPDVVARQRHLLHEATKKGYLAEEDLIPEEKAAIQTLSKKRGGSNSPFRITNREEVHYRLTVLGLQVKQAVIAANLTGEEFSVLTPEMIQSGSWKNGSFRPYGINAPTSRLIPGRRNAYSQYLEWVKNKLIALGFEEFDGPLVETEFWNGDALFMPQFHSARDIHDVYYVKDPQHCDHIDEPWLSQVAATHENGWKTGSRGWNYTFDHEFTRRQILRSQGTVLSAHQLTKAKVPGKYFGIVRCFRYDQVDATHGADFYQTEGIVVGEDVNLRNLLGLLKMFAEEVAGAEEVKYVPGYFPFTEPSIEVHIKHPKLGWFELGGSGIFRPEVTQALGIDVPVLAWGLGIDRMALMHLGLNDLRELFTPDIENVRTRRGN